MPQEEQRKWSAAPDRDPKAVLKPRAIVMRALGGFLLGGFLGTFLFPHREPLTLRSFGAGVAASGAFLAFLMVVLPLGPLFKRPPPHSLTAIHAIAALAGAVGGVVWWGLANSTAPMVVCAVVGAVVGIIAIHGA